MKRFLLTVFSILAAFNTMFAQSPTTSFDVAGIKVIYRPTLKDIISVRMYFRGGVTNYTPEKAGIEQLAIGAATECGTKKYDANLFKDIADQYGIEIGGGAEYDYANIDMVCISKYINQGWGLFAEAVMNPVFDANEVELLKTKVINNVKERESDPDKRADHLLLENAFKGTPYEIDPDGTEQTLTAITPNMLKEYYHELLNKNRMFIVVAGKISKEELIEKITSSFASLPLKPYKAVNYNTPVWNDNKVAVENRALATNYIRAIVNAPVMSSPDYLPYRMGISALSGSLYSEIRVKRNLSYDPGAHTERNQMPYAIMEVSTTSPKEAITVMMTQLNRAKNQRLLSSGLKELKSGYITSNYIKQQASNAITGNLGSAEILGDWRLFEELPDRLEEVTPDQIYKALNKYITGVRWSYLGDENLAKEADSAFNMGVR